jgi:hypothetical protein
MPPGVLGFLVYAVLILAGIGLALPYVVDLAMAAPVSLPGIVVMVLLAYTIFTVTLVLQRKEAARSLALGLSSLTLPVVPWLVVVGQLVGALFLGLLFVVLVRGLRSPAARAFLSEP